MAGGSYFKGWTSTLPYLPTLQRFGSADELSIGHVLTVDYDNDIGKITTRLVGITKELQDDDVTTVAYPADLNIIKYPLPGELVLLVKSLSSEVQSVYFYTTVLSSDQSVIYNSDPYILQTVPTPFVNKVFTPQYEVRFENKLNVKERFIASDGSLVNRPSLKPREGDFVIQGRFGNVIKMGSTGENNSWSNQSTTTKAKVKATSNVGDPIMFIGTNRPPNDTKSTEFVESVNSPDQTSMYLCTSQELGIVMSTSKGLRTHLHRYDLNSLTVTSDQSSSFLATTFIPGGMGGYVPMGMGGSGQVIAHAATWDGPGGMSGENILVDFEQCVKNNIDIIEIDIQVTSDNVPVLYHDNTLDKNTNSTGTIQTKKWADVQKITYNSNKQTIPSLDQCMAVLAKYPSSPSKVQFDKCGDSEWAVIVKQPWFQTYKSRFIAKSTSFTPPGIVKQYGIPFQPILPSDYAGKMTTEAIINQIAQSTQGAQMLELQFTMADSLLFNGTLAQRLSAVNCVLVGISVGGSQYTNPKGNWADSEDYWNKFWGMGCAAVMTNHPSKLKGSTGAITAAATNGGKTPGGTAINTANTNNTQPSNNTTINKVVEKAKEQKAAEELVKKALKEQDHDYFGGGAKF